VRIIEVVGSGVGGLMWFAVGIVDEVWVVLGDLIWL
jgi:hypothetical protein